MKNIVFIIFLSLIFNYATSQERERILNYDVDIQVHKDRSIEVKELIQVYASGNVIKRGITKDLPSYRQMEIGSLKMKYEVIDVQKNSVPENYFTKDNESGFVIYIGNKDIFLTPGIYTYLIHYKVPNQIGFFNNYDEIYWNAIGTDVMFEIEKASCTVTLPEGANILQREGYVGKLGDQGKNFEIEENNKTINFTLNNRLAPKEGFTFAVGFEKGIVDSPGFLARYGTLLIIFMGTLFILPYYFYTWWRYGQDPKAPSSEMAYDPPNNLSPASINYILSNGGNHNRSFTATVISLAVKGYISIEEKEAGIFSKRDYILYKKKDASDDLYDEEIKLMQALFKNSDHVLMGGEYNYIVAKALKDHKNSLSDQHHAFIMEGNNFNYALLPILVTMGIIILGFIAYKLTPYSYGINLILLIIFAVISIVGLFLYIYLIRQPTLERVTLLSNIKGYGEYLSLVDDFESGDTQQQNDSTEHFEENLPYAFALGQESKWSERFKRVLDKRNYQPRWSNHSNIIIFSNGFSHNFSSRSIATATKPVESTGGGFSGSGGGGFSGGGGGGGGVGGW